MAGVYWSGADGNTYVRADGVNNGEVMALGPNWDQNQLAVDLVNGLSRIDDPNPPRTTGVLGATTGGTTQRTVPSQNEINTSRDNTISGGNTQLANKTSEYDQNQTKFLNTVQDTQDTINTGKATNALNLRRSMSSIAGSVRQGLRSGGVMLANMGASDSGAAQAMADAYAKEGNGQAADANNQAMLQDEVFNQQQVKLNRDKDQGIQDFNTWKTTQTNTIKAGLVADLATLNAQAQANGLQSADLGQVDALVNTALAQMAAIDARTAGRVGGIRGSTAEEANAKAIQMDQAGMASGPAFSTGGADLFQPAGGGQELQGAPITQIPLRFNKRTF